MEVTIREVAEQAGVSVSTASRILNGGTKGLRRDAAARAELVLTAARELNYRPNAAARGLVMKRSFAIGFIATELENPVRSRQLETLRVAALEKGYHLLAGGVRYGEPVEAVLANMLGRGVDGLIFGNLQELPAESLEFLRRSEVPAAWFGGCGAEGDGVVIDYGRMCEKLTCHLIEVHGHRRIVFAGASQSYPRLDGYRAAMAAAGLEAAVLGTEHFTLEGGGELAARIAAQAELPEAVVCHNDLVAIGLMHGLRRRGIDVPGQIAVTGLDDIDMAACFNPGLTTAGCDVKELTRSLFRMLIERIEDGYEGASRHIHCHEELLIRESCGCKTR